MRTAPSSSGELGMAAAASTAGSAGRWCTRTPCASMTALTSGSSPSCTTSTSAGSTQRTRSSEASVAFSSAGRLCVSMSTGKRPPDAIKARMLSDETAASSASPRARLQQK